MKVSCDPDPFLNTLNYDVEFSCDEIKEHSVNVIAKNIHSQVDEELRNIKMLDSVVCCRKDRNTVDKANMLLCTKSWQKCLRHTTSG